MYTFSTTMKKVNSQIAYEYMRKQILNGSYAPGYKLIAEDQSKLIGVSRTPVREALRSLESDGLVTIAPHYGARVKIVDIEDFVQLCEFRLALEVHAAGLAALNRRDVQLRNMKRILDEMTRLSLTTNRKNLKTEYGFPEEIAKQNVLFHMEIIESAHNWLFKEEIERLHLIERVAYLGAAFDKNYAKELNHDYGVVDSRDESEHLEIFNAIVERNPTKAETAMRKHMKRLVVTMSTILNYKRREKRT